ncbi:MAG: flippase-like domain-containing protein [Gammaproteobacteria bacterium]|nr:flippase-like domain-containing protein [Gammaproteobacteria bacterium]NNC76816.1 flippase-like domain-containing protein [Woeseiaceae bacterium]
MTETLKKGISWLAGIVALVAIVWYFRPQGFVDSLISVGVAGVGAWCALTVIARLVLARTTVEPVNALGYPFKLADAFWIGWLRTFANQIVPMSGVAAYVKLLRARTDISWSEVAALATPQFVLAAAALSLIGLAAVASNFLSMRSSAFWLAVMYGAILVVTLVIAKGGARLLKRLPAMLSAKVASVGDALRKFATHPGLITRLVVYHVVVIVLRGGRLWVLFAATGFNLEWQQMLMVLAVAESSLLIQLTPGGMGVREAAVLGGAALVGISPDAAVGVALIDRLFMIGITVVFAAPAAMILSSNQQIDN